MAIKIKKIRTRGTIETSVKVATRSVESAGRAHQAQGRAVAEFRKTANEIGNMIIKDRRADYLDTQNAEMFLEASEIVTEEKLNADEDFGGYAERVSSRMQKSLEARIKAAPDNRSGDILKSKSQAFMARHEAAAMQFEQTESMKFRVNNISKTSKAMGLHYLENPDFEEGSLQIQEREQFIDGRNLSASQRTALKDESASQIAQGNVLGFTKIGEYALARGMVEADFGSVYSKNPALAKKTLKAITTAETAAGNARHIEQQRQRVNDKFDHEVAEEEFMSKMLIRSAQGLPTDEMMTQALSQGIIDSSSFRVLSNDLASTQEKKMSRNNELKYTLMLMSDVSPDKVQALLIKDIASGQIGTESSLKILDDIRLRRKELKAKDPRDKNALKALKAAFTPSGFAGDFNQTVALELSAATTMYTNFRNKVFSAEAAKNETIRQFKGDFSAIPLIPGIPLVNQTSAQTYDKEVHKEVIKNIEDRREKGQLSDAQYMLYLKLADRRKEASEVFKIKPLEGIDGTNNKR